MASSPQSTGPVFSGVYPMQFAFFGPDGALDRAAMRKQVEGCIGFGVDGIALLGLGTEVNKLSTDERRKVVDWVAEDVAGRVPLCVTIAENSIHGQRDFARYAQDAGAAWIVLQPPQVRGVGEAEYIRFFSGVADAVSVPFGIQNAPEYTGIGVSNAAIVELARRHANFRVLKGEGPALLIRRAIEETEGKLAVFNGRAGLELTDNIRAGCAGMIPGSESADIQKRIFDHATSADPARQAEAEALYRQLLPMVVFVIQSLENFLCYGKALAAARFGITDTTIRAPGILPTEFGLASLRQSVSALFPDLDPGLIR
nr:dihydrodipicolinate synthase family protein [Devosia faecipullorum]